MIPPPAVWLTVLLVVLSQDVLDFEEQWGISDATIDATEALFDLGDQEASA